MEDNINHLMILNNYQIRHTKHILRFLQKICSHNCKRVHFKQRYGGMSELNPWCSNCIFSLKWKRDEFKIVSEEDLYLPVHKGELEKGYHLMAGISCRSEKDVIMFLSIKDTLIKPVFKKIEEKKER